MTVDLVAALFQCFSKIHRRDRAIQRTLLAGFSLELEIEGTHLLRLRLGCSALFRFLLQQRRSFLFNSLNVARSCLYREIARQQVVASVTRPNPDDFAACAEIIYIFAQKYFRMCHLPSLLSLSRSCTEAARCCARA